MGRSFTGHKGITPPWAPNRRTEVRGARGGCEYVCCSGVKHIDGPVPFSSFSVGSREGVFRCYGFKVTSLILRQRDIDLHHSVFRVCFLIILILSLLCSKPDVLFFSQQKEEAENEVSVCLLGSGLGSHGCINCS